MKKCLLFLFLIIAGLAHAQQRYDVVIDEIMADPAPQIGLPASEWIELKNTSAVSIDLYGWRICDLSGQSGGFPSFILQPDSFVIITGNAAASNFLPFGAVIGVSTFPSLDNNGETIFLQAADGRVIHAISYTVDWYHNDLKKDGGWSLEMIDIQNSCVGAGNWKASVNENGGTPGSRNSVNGMFNDHKPPGVINAFTSDSITIHLVFEAPLDSSSAIVLANYSIDQNISLTQVELTPPLFNEVKLTTNTALSEKLMYNVRTTALRDCIGNVLMDEEVSTGIPSPVAKDDIVISEILFNPRTNGYDYVELYNRSDKIIDASVLSVCNRKTNGTLNAITRLAADARYMLPGSYLVFTEDAANLALNYLVKDNATILTMAALPSLPDDEGHVGIVNPQGNIIDEVHYSERWHFELIENPEGISLERIDMNMPSIDAKNWHSAASTAGYGTPGYKNSQSRNVQNTTGVVTTSPQIFSPDNDGWDDFLDVEYHLVEPGYVANITIFDATGRPVRNLVRNAMLGIAGSWKWDGLDEKGLKLRIGTYIILTELFNLKGEKQKFRNAVVLARRLGR